MALTRERGNALNTKDGFWQFEIRDKFQGRLPGPNRSLWPLPEICNGFFWNENDPLVWIGNFWIHWQSCIIPIVNKREHLHLSVNWFIKCDHFQIDSLCTCQYVLMHFLTSSIYPSASIHLSRLERCRCQSGGARIQSVWAETSKSAQRVILHFHASCLMEQQCCDFILWRNKSQRQGRGHIRIADFCIQHRCPVQAIAMQ